MNNESVGDNFAQQIVSGMDHLFEIALNIADLASILSAEILLIRDWLVILDFNEVPFIQTIDVRRVSVSADIGDVQDMIRYCWMHFLVQDVTSANSDCYGLFEG